MSLGLANSTAISPIKFRLPTVKFSQVKAVKEVNTPEIKKPLAYNSGLGKINMLSPRELRAKYKAFENHEDIYTAAFQAVEYFGHYIKGTQLYFDYTKTSDFTNIKRMEENMQRGLAVPSSEDATYLKYDSKVVETKLSNNTLTFRIPIRADEGNLEVGYRTKIERIIQQYIPAFKMPSHFAPLEDESEEDSVKTKEPRVIVDRVSNEMSIESFALIKPDYEFPETFSRSGTKSKEEGERVWGAAKYFKFPSGWVKNNFKDIVRLKFDVVPSPFSSTSLAYYSDKATLTSGPLTELAKKSNSTIFVSFDINITIIFRWPIQLALYATCCENPAEFIPFMFYQYNAWHRLSYSSNTTKGGGRTIKAPGRVNHLGNITKMIDNERAMGRVIKPRTDANGFVILGAAEGAKAGSVFWVPPNVNRVPEYLTIIRSLYNSETKSIDLSLAKKTTLASTGVLTDWNSEKFSYMLEQGIGGSSTNASGIDTIDLSGSIPLDEVTLYHKLSTTVADDRDFWLHFASICQKLENGDLGVNLPKSLLAPDYLETLPGIQGTKYAAYSTPETLIKMLINGSIGYGIDISNIGGRSFDFEASNEAEKRSQLLLRSICNIFKEYAKFMSENFDKLRLSYLYRIHKLKFVLHMLLNCSDDATYEKYRNIALEKYKSNVSVVGKGKGDVSKVLLPNLTGVKSLMPHQVESLNSLSGDGTENEIIPEAALVDIHMGGGKCVDYSTIIPTSHGIMKAGEIYEQLSGEDSHEKGFKVANFSISYNKKKTKVSHTYKTSGKMIRLRTSAGDKFVSLRTHKLWALKDNGSIKFTNAEDINKGDWMPKIIGTRLFPTTNYPGMTNALARILGLLTAEGYVDTNFVSFTNTDDEVLDQFLKDWKSVFGRDNLRKYVKNDSNNTSLHSNKKERDFLVSMGLTPELSMFKEVPFSIRQSTEKVQCEFLRMLFEGDGTIYQKKSNNDKSFDKYARWVIEYDSISDQLVQQVKYMLENIGIPSEMRSTIKVTTFDGVQEKRTEVFAHSLRIAASFIGLFDSHVGFFSSRKKDLMEKAYDLYLDRSITNNKRSTNFFACGFENKLPVGKFAARLVNRIAMIVSDIKYMSEDGRNIPYSMNRFWRNSVEFKTDGGSKSHAANLNNRIRNSKEVISRYYTKKLIEAIEEQPDIIRSAIENDAKAANLVCILKRAIKYIWVKVESKIYDKKDSDAYDLTVPGPHAYTANGFTSHNSLVSVTDACNLIFKNKIKRALLIVPGNLVKNTINEINKFSNGAVNPFAITLQTVRRINTVVRPDDTSTKPNYEVLKKLITSAPKNTVFVTNYRFTICDSEDIVYGNNIVTRHYAAEFLRDIGFDFVAVDESHFAKNLGSQQTQAVASVLSVAKYKRELSGTMVSNTLTDLVGQGAMINPAMFGTSESFNAKYGLEVAGNNVIVWHPNAAKMISEDSAAYTMKITHKRQRWAFMLPHMIEQFHPVNFTENQKQFYLALLEEAIDKITKENKKLWDKMQSGSEKDTKDIEQGFATYFQAVEQFVYAPDSNAAFVQLDTVTDEDLVSPKIETLVKILDTHFEKSKHKVVVFSHRKATSAHVMEHLPERFKRIAVRYTAGDDKALEYFQKNDACKILVGDEMSINTGQNLQVASRLIRLETLWSPGNQDQATARVWRPEFTLLGENKGDRLEVHVDWIFTNGSLECAKIARLISKIIEKAKYDYQDNLAFTDFALEMPDDKRAQLAKSLPQVSNRNVSVSAMLNSLPLIKMNASTFLKFDDVRLLGEYFATYSLLNIWEDMEFEKEKSSGTQRLITVPKESYVEIPNSAKLKYIPRVPGTDPDIVDPERKFEYKPVSIIDMENAMSEDSDNDREDDNYVDVYNLSIGEIVDTEFGFGYVEKILQSDIRVSIPGLKNTIKVPKATAWVIGNDEEYAKVEKALKSPNSSSLLRFPGAIISEADAAKIKEDKKKENVNIVTKPKPEVHKPSEEKYEVEEVDVDTDSQIEMFAEIVDGHVALTCFAEDQDSEILVDQFGFSLLPEYVAVKIPTVKALDAILSVMSKFKVNSVQLELIEQYRPYIMNRTVDRITHEAFAEANRFLKVDAHKRLKDGFLRPLPVVWGGSFFLCFLKQQTPSVTKFIMAIKKAMIPNVKISIQSALHIKMFPTATKAYSHLEAIYAKVDIPNIEETVDSLRKIKQLRIQSKKGNVK